MKTAWSILPATAATDPLRPPVHEPSYSGPRWSGLEPRRIAAAYGIRDAGFRGQGRRVALIEPGQRLDKQEFREWAECWGPFEFELRHEIVVDS